MRKSKLNLIAFSLFCILYNGSPSLAQVDSPPTAEGSVSLNDINRLKAAIDTLSLQFDQQKQAVEKQLENFAPSMVPVGAIVSYIGDLSKIGPAWRVCDGSTISDAESPLNGSKTPVLNDYRYLIGVPNQQTINTEIGMNRWERDGSHAHTFDGETITRFNIHQGVGDGAHEVQTRSGSHLKPISFPFSGQTHHAGGHDHGEKRPLSRGVHWIMRIK